MMRKPMIAGNWKLHKTLTESRQLASALVKELSTANHCDIVIAPVFTALSSVAETIADSPIHLAAQNCYPVETGAFTGEVSPTLLKDVGCRHIICGHSERRQLLNETNQLINQKVTASISAGLGAILCIGETLQERETDQMLEVLATQIREGLAGITSKQMAAVVLAYEPVWAIGTGVTATDSQAQDAHSFIRGLLQGLYNQEVAGTTRILYGGSVKPNNIDGLMAQRDIDGALVGGASLKADDFCRIVRFES